mgnify:CR=1 FL=1
MTKTRLPSATTGARTGIAKCPVTTANSGVKILIKIPAGRPIKSVATTKIKLTIDPLIKIYWGPTIKYSITTIRANKTAVWVSDKAFLLINV